MNHCSLRYWPWSCWVLHCKATWTNSIHCHFTCNGRYNICSCGLHSNLIASLGKACIPNAYNSTMVSLTCFSKISSLANGKLCRIPFWWVHMSHEMFHSFLISSNTQCFPDRWLWTRVQQFSWYSLHPWTIHPSKSQCHPRSSCSKTHCKIGQSHSRLFSCHWAKHHKWCLPPHWDVLLSQNHCLSFCKAMSQVSVTRSCWHLVICALFPSSPQHGQSDTDQYCHLFMFFPWPKNRCIFCCPASNWLLYSL